MTFERYGGAKFWLAMRLRFLADRIHPVASAPRAMGISFTFERGVGIVFNEERRGCPLWYLSHADYDRAHEEAVDPSPRIDWATMTIRP